MKRTTLLFASLLFLFTIACNKKKEQPIEHYEQIPVIIKFDIPKASINNVSKVLSAGIKKEIEDKINSKYPSIDSLTLIHYGTIPKFGDYCEYGAVNADSEVVNIFGIKHQTDSIAVNAFISEIPLGTDTRYEISNRTLSVYKQTNYNNETISICYGIEKNILYFCRDDGFSQW